MDFIYFLTTIFLLAIAAYMAFLQMFKYAVLQMHANDKNALSNLLRRSSPYAEYLPDRNLPLSIVLNENGIFSKFVKSNSLVTRLDDYLVRYATSGDVSFLEDLEENIDSKFLYWLNRNGMGSVVSNNPEKLYFLKLAIIVRLFKALKNIKRGGGLQPWKTDLLSFNDFSKSPLMERIYLSFCNLQMVESKMEPIVNVEPSCDELCDFIENTKLNEFQHFVSTYFYWHENPDFSRSSKK